MRIKWFFSHLSAERLPSVFFRSCDEERAVVRCSVDACLLCDVVVDFCCSCGVSFCAAKGCECDVACLCNFFFIFCGANGCENDVDFGFPTPPTDDLMDAIRWASLSATRPGSPAPVFFCTCLIIYTIHNLSSNANNNNKHAKCK